MVFAHVHFFLYLSGLNFISIKVINNFNILYRMKKCTFLLALLAISMMMTAQLHGNWSAKQAFKPSEKSVIASMLTATSTPESTVVLEEDFS